VEVEGEREKRLFIFIYLFFRSTLTGLCVGMFVPTWCCQCGAFQGAALYLQECGQECSGKFQNFTVETSTIYTNFNKLCVEGYAKNVNNQTDVRLNNCNSSNEQTWDLSSNGEFKNPMGECITVSRGDEVWAAPMSDGTQAVVLFNRASANQSVSVKWSEIGIDGSATVRDLWQHKSMGSFPSGYTASVDAQGAVALRVTRD